MRTMIRNRKRTSKDAYNYLQLRQKSSEGGQVLLLLKLLTGLGLIMPGEGLYLITLEGLVESFFKIYCYKITKLSVIDLWRSDDLCLSKTRN